MSIKQILSSGTYATHRVEAFSDGIFAITITLLVLNISTPSLAHPSNTALYKALLLQLPKIIIYIVSFINIAVYWINHHQLFSILRKTDRGFLWLNCLMLMILAFIPFPTSVVGQYPNQITAIAFFGLVMILAALCFGTMRAYATYYSCLINCEKIELSVVKKTVLQSFSGAIFYLVAILLGFISTKISIALFFLIPLFYAFPSKLTNEAGAC